MTYRATVRAEFMMIADHARAYGSKLVTSNVGEFKRVQGLALEN
jgi:predicted nucleic acid-binding protein